MKTLRAVLGSIWIGKVLGLALEPLPLPCLRLAFLRGELLAAGPASLECCREVRRTM